MTIWWCVEHKAESKGEVIGRGHYQCWKSWVLDLDGSSCVLAEMNLTAVLEPFQADSTA